MHALLINRVIWCVASLQMTVSVIVSSVIGEIDYPSETDRSKAPVLDIRLILYQTTGVV